MERPLPAHAVGPVVREKERHASEGALLSPPPGHLRQLMNASRVGACESRRAIGDLALPLIPRSALVELRWVRAASTRTRRAQAAGLVAGRRNVVLDLFLARSAFIPLSLRQSICWRSVLFTPTEWTRPSAIAVTALETDAPFVSPPRIHRHSAAPREDDPVANRSACLFSSAASGKNSLSLGWSIPPARTTRRRKCFFRCVPLREATSRARRLMPVAILRDRRFSSRTSGSHREAFPGRGGGLACKILRCKGRDENSRDNPQRDRRGEKTVHRTARPADDDERRNSRNRTSDPQTPFSIPRFSHFFPCVRALLASRASSTCFRACLARLSAAAARAAASCASLSAGLCARGTGAGGGSPNAARRGCGL